MTLEGARGTVKGPNRLKPEMIDGPRTKAWGDGGYHGRLFLNRKGREPEGLIDPSDGEKVRSDLIVSLFGLEPPDRSASR